MTASSYDFKGLRKDALPTTNQSLDVWLLRGQQFLLNKNSETEDEIVNMLFTGFSKIMSHTFSQTLVPTVQPYNHALVIEGGVFRFVNMDTPQTYEVQNTLDLSQVFRTFNQLVDQDIKYLNQLKSLQNMLISAKVFQSTSTTTIKPLSGITLRSTLPVEETLPRVSPNFTKTRFPRNIDDIFSPYSVTEIGNTAGQNYKKMNRNFAKIDVTEERLSHQQTILATKFQQLNKLERNLQRKEIYLELRAFRASFFSNFMYDLEQILEHNRLDPVYDILFSLIRQHEFCYSDKCFLLPIFNILNETAIQVNMQTAKQSLAPAAYISCTLTHNLRTSIYSHQIALIDGQTLNFKQDQLPSITFADLIHPNIDLQTRPIQPTDLVQSILYVLYSEKKVSLQCLESQMITVDNVQSFCDSNTINFIDFPSEITIGSKEILKFSIPHHFSTKFQFMSQDLTGVTIFQETNGTQLHFGHHIKNFFEQATEVHWSLMFVAFFCLVLLAVIGFCPSCLLNILCCFRNTCSFKQRVYKREFELEEVRRVRRRNRPLAENPTETSPMVWATAPAVDPVPPQPQPKPQQPQPSRQQQPPRTSPYPYVCPNKLMGCYCAQNGTQCMSTQYPNIQN